METKINEFPSYDEFRGKATSIDEAVKSDLDFKFADEEMNKYSENYAKKLITSFKAVPKAITVVDIFGTEDEKTFNYVITLSNDNVIRAFRVVGFENYQIEDHGRTHTLQKSMPKYSIKNGGIDLILKMYKDWIESKLIADK